jgi:hypothetical protein
LHWIRQAHRVHLQKIAEEILKNFAALPIGLKSIRLAVVLVSVSDMTAQAQDSASSGPSLDFTMNYIQSKLESSFTFFAGDKNRGSKVELDRDGNVSIRWRDSNFKIVDGEAKAVFRNQLVEFNVRDMATDGFDTYSDGFTMKCANKLFCVHLTLDDGVRHRKDIDVGISTVDYEKVMHAFMRYLVLLGGSRVAKDPF